jgi:hypothetical protein
MACYRDSFTLPFIDGVAQLYPKAPDSLFVAYYDSQGYRGGIIIHLHTEEITSLYVTETVFVNCKKKSGLKVNPVLVLKPENYACEENRRAVHSIIPVHVTYNICHAGS